MYLLRDSVVVTILSSLLDLHTTCGRFNQAMLVFFRSEEDSLVISCE